MIFLPGMAFTDGTLLMTVVAVAEEVKLRIENPRTHGCCRLSETAPELERALIQDGWRMV